MVTPSLQRIRARLHELWRPPRPTASRNGSRAAAGATRPASPPGGAEFSRRVEQPVDLELFHCMRRGFPVLDIGLTKLVQLVGCPQIRGAATLVNELTTWGDQLHVAPASRSLDTWIRSHVDASLTYGKSVTSAYLSPTRRDLAAVEVLDPRRIRFEYTADQLHLRTLYRRQGGPEAELPPASTLTSVHAPQLNPHGSSLLRSLPFIAEALTIVQNATAQLWLRVGNPSFHVNWQPPADFSDPDGTVAAEVTGDLETSWAAMMTSKSSGQVRDFFTTGTISVRAIGADNQTAEVQAPARLFAEQMAAVTGLPPWMLGLHWSSTEHMAVQQADMLAANIEAIRREVQPAAEQLIELRQALTGRRGRWSLAWPTIDLRDATEQARARSWEQNARNARIANARSMWALGFWTQLQAAADCDPALTTVARPLATPPAAAAAGDTPPPPPGDANST